MRHFPLLAGLLTLRWLAGAALAAKPCYYPNGEQNLMDNTVCDPDADVSMCCASGDSCLSNGLCASSAKTDEKHGIQYYRGSCTDKTWDSAICPQMCLKNNDLEAQPGAYDFKSHGVRVWQCDGQGWAQPARYCCESASEYLRCCSTSESTFALSQATVGNAHAVQTWSGEIGGSASVITATVAQTTVYASDVAIGPGGAKAVAATASSTAACGAGQNGDGLSRDTQIVIGVCIPTAMLSLVAIFVWFFWARQRKLAGPRRVDSASPPPSSSSSSAAAAAAARVGSSLAAAAGAGSSSARRHAWPGVRRSRAYGHGGSGGSGYKQHEMTSVPMSGRPLLEPRDNSPAIYLNISSPAPTQQAWPGRPDTANLHASPSGTHWTVPSSATNTNTTTTTTTNTAGNGNGSAGGSSPATFLNPGSAPPSAYPASTTGSHTGLSRWQSNNSRGMMLGSRDVWGTAPVHELPVPQVSEMEAKNPHTTHTAQTAQTTRGEWNWKFRT